LGERLEIVILNQKGQVTIPARIRKTRGFRGGMRVGLVEIGTRIELMRIPDDPIEGLAGLGSKLPSLEEIESEADVE
jgi:AbrB family looped-hinge helix DNA binding protein